MKKNAFSLTETLILLVILAIAIGAATPTLTRKIINTTEAGTTLSGGTHGRYEIFTKEILELPDGPYEKTTDPDSSGNIVVFRRLTDAEYIKIVNHVPSVSSNGKYKQTLYEQIDNPKIHRDSNKEINFVEFDDDGSSSTPDKKYPIGGNIIAESADIIYVKGCLNKSSTPKTFTEKGKAGCLGAKTTLPNNSNRIIEGNLTDKYSKPHPDTKRPLWHLDATSANNEIPVVPIPWERIISGDEIIKDDPIPPTTKPGGEIVYIGKFTPDSNAQNLVVHAVGGGGAGGGILDGNLKGVVTPKNASATQLQTIKKDLADRFKAVALAKGYTALASKSTDEIVGVINYSKSYKLNFENDPNIANYFGINRESNENSGKYILLNKADGTITVRVDVRNGLIFPHELLDYTKVLGSATQESVKFDMPVWGKFSDIYNRGFRASSVGCATNGGASDGLKIVVDKSGFWNKGSCGYKKYCPGLTENCTNTKTCRIRDGGCWAAKLDYEKIQKEFGITGFAIGIKFNNNNLIARMVDACPECKASGSGSSGSGSSGSSSSSKPSCTQYDPIDEDRCLSKKCTYTCSETYYSDITEDQTVTSSCPSNASCPANNAKWNGTPCTNTYTQGAGGSAYSGPYGSCAIACTRVSGPVQVTKSCWGTGASGSMKSVDPYGTISLFSGAQGRSCSMSAGDKTAFAGGGGGGNPIVQSKYSGMYFDGNITGTVADNGYAAAMATENPSAYQQHIIETYRKEAIIESGYDFVCYAYGGICGSGNGTPGASGSGHQGCDNTDGTDVSNDGLYNHIYTWTMPYSVNQLTYGEGGGVGEYKTTTISKPNSQEITFELGKGGVWSAGAWDDGKQGPDGTATIVKMGSTNIITANGGKGGRQSQMTHKYDLCYAAKGVCARRDASGTIVKDGNGNELKVDCCNEEEGTRSTRDIRSTSGSLSELDDKKALTGNSRVVGIGAGRSGDGVGSRAGLETNYGDRGFVNASGYKVTWPTSSVFTDYMAQIKNKATTESDYENKALTPSAHNFKGGDGAVIVTW